MSLIWVGNLIGFPLRAIPNQIGVGFFNLAGMRLEDFAALPETWKPGVPLKATWELWKEADVTDTAVELQRLTVPATVFGFLAAKVVVHRVDEQVRQFTVTFVPEPGKSTADLEMRLRRNLAAWSESVTAEGVYLGGATAIALESKAGDEAILAVFTPAPGATVTALAK
ncbi:MAG: hypothetical protein KDM64_01230 [Verrucomicrobiae bacterium]|nr:hypothetical protein [Verrucomicrobiae bacterium]